MTEARTGVANLATDALETIGVLGRKVGAVVQPGKLEALETIDVAAPARDVFDLITSMQRWPQLFTTMVHTQVLPSDGDATDIVRCWGVSGRETVRAWSARRWIMADELRMDFDNDPPPPGVREQHGQWAVEARGDDSCVVTLRHRFDCGATGPADLAERVASQFSRHSRAQLAELKTAAERGPELDELIVSWEDTLVTTGAVQDAWLVLYEADKWPERIPHVARIEMTEPAPGIQFFDMDTTTPDGAAHTTRSVRVCLPHQLIVYKQTTLPPILEAHTGHWRFTETSEGLVLGARHTVTLKRSALGLLGAGTTVADARAYARRVLSANSMKNLQIAKAYAEEAARV